MNVFIKLKFPATKVRANLHLKEIKKHLDLEFTPQGNKKTFGLEFTEQEWGLEDIMCGFTNGTQHVGFNTDETY